MLDDAFLANWCNRHLGARPARVLFRSGHLSQVVAAELADGRRVVIKARPFDPRIVGCAPPTQAQSSAHRVETSHERPTGNITLGKALFQNNRLRRLQAAACCGPASTST